MTTDGAVVTPANASRWEDLIDVYFSPGELFARRAHESWIKPFILLCAICIVLYYVFLPINAVLWDAMMVENAPPNADLDQMRKGAAMMKYLGGIMIPIGFGLSIAGTALVMKLVSSVMEPGASWAQSFLIATFAAFVVIPQQILGSLLIFIKSGSGAVATKDASFGALRFVEDPDPVLKAVLGRFDIFPIWSAILCAIGLIVVVRMPRGKAFATAAIAWLAIALPGLAMAAFSGKN